jgi:hypothetical protein
MQNCSYGSVKELVLITDFGLEKFLIGSLIDELPKCKTVLLHKKLSPAAYLYKLFTITMAFLQIQHSFLTKMQNHNIHQLNSTKRAAL